MSGGWNSQNQGGGPGPNDPRYGQTPHGQQGQTGPAYGQAHYGQQQPYGTPPGQNFQPAQEPWSQSDSLYGNPYAHAHAMPPAKRSDMLGIVGLGVVFVATVVLIIVSWTGGQSFGQFILDAEASGLYTEEDLANDPLAMAYVRSATGLVLGAIGVCVVGLAGWVTSIVATVQRRGRGFGVVGIILGVLSLGIAFAAFFTGVVPVLGYDN